jgi:ABC-2 type transport system ATP-binding protein
VESIVAENLVKTYRNGVKALTGVSFAVRQGEIFGLLGPNGAGKSTTVRILATLTRPDQGAARIMGKDALADPAEARRRIGYVAQASGVDKWATGRENLALQAHLVRVPAAQFQARIAYWLDWVGLTEAAHRIVKTYSGGMKRRLDLALGLVHEPEVLFLDEPTTGLDPETRAALWRDLDRLRGEKQLTVLLTTHYLEEADHLCDRLAIVDHGRIVVEGRPADLKAAIRKGGAAEPTLNDVYLHHTGSRYASGEDEAPTVGEGKA